MQNNYEVDSLHKQNKHLKIACSILLILTFIFYVWADRPSFVIYEDMSIEFNPGIWYSNEPIVHAYPSKFLDDVIEIGYYDSNRNRVYSLSWVMFVQNSEELKHSNKPITPAQRDSIRDSFYRKFNFDSFD